MNKILVTTSIVTAAAVLIYTVFAGLQWLAIRKQAEHTAIQVAKMQGQLDAMNRQADISDKLLTETSNLVGHNDNMVKVMEGQLKATQRASETAYVAQRAHLGIISLNIGGALAVGESPTLSIAWKNGGKTPASNFRCIADLVLSNEEPSRDLYYADDDYSDISGSFWPSDSTQTLFYPQGHITVTDELVTELWRGQGRRMWAVIRAVYLDISGEVQWFYNAALWIPEPLYQREGHFIETFQYIEFVSEREKAEKDRQKEK